MTPLPKGNLRPSSRRHDDTLKHVAILERRLPKITKLSRHPRYGRWFPPLVAALEVGASLVAFYLLNLLVMHLVPDIDIPLPDVDLPQLPVPEIQLPSLPLPDLPPLPAWLQNLLYWSKKTFPIWIAVAYAAYEMRKEKKSKKGRQR